MASSAVLERPRLQWYGADKGDENICQYVTGAFRYLDREQAYHRERDLHHMRLYSNRLAASMTGRAFSEFYPWELDSGLRINIVQAIIDAACAQISTNRPRGMPVTVDQDYKEERKAKKLGQFGDGLFHSTQQYMLSQAVFLHAAIFGSGVEKVYSKSDDVATETVLMDEIVVDDVEASRGKPRTLYQYKEAAPEVIAQEFGIDPEELRGCGLLRDDHLGRHHIYNPISVIEAWHLPSSKDADDGRHVICVDKKTLLDEPWTRSRFPFAIFHWKLPVQGFRGIGMAEELNPLQIELNYTCERASRLMWHAVPVTWVPKGTVNDLAWTNEENVVREYSGSTPPTKTNAAALPPEMLGYIEQIINRGYALTGVSQMSAASVKPAGINSGTAIKAYNDIQSARFLHVGQRFEQFHMDVLELMIEEAGDLDKRLRKKGGYKTLSRTRRGLEELNFADVDLDRDKYILQVMPGSYLPATPPGKLDAIERFSQINPTMAKYLLSELDNPDLERAISIANAPVEIVDMAIDAIIERGEYIAPEPSWGPDTLNMGIERATLQLMRYQTRKLEPEKQQMIRDWIGACVGLIKMQTPTPPPAMPVAPPGPQQQPGAVATPPPAM